MVCSVRMEGGPALSGKSFQIVPGPKVCSMETGSGSTERESESGTNMSSGKHSDAFLVAFEIAG